jgi:hypothetical protein
MPPLFGDIRQIAFVSDDIDRSMRHFVGVWNIGPWHVMRHVKETILHKGAPSDIDLSVAISNNGDLQFEIIQQHNEAPSVYREWRAKMTSGLNVQHLAVWVDDFAKARADAMARGWTPVLESAAGVGNACYLGHPAEPLLYLEISDRSPGKERMRAAVRRASELWDGSDPIREGLSLA